MAVSAKGQQARQYAFTHFSTANGLASNFVHSITQDKDGFLWLATVNGLQRYDGYRFLTFRSGRGQRSGLPGDEISKLYYDKKGILWLVLPNNQVGHFDTRTFTYTPIETEGPPSTYNSPVTMWEDANGELLMQEMNATVYRYDRLQKKMVPYPALNPMPEGWRCRKMVWDRGINRYWAAADSGLVLYDPATQRKSYRNHNIEKNDVIRKLGHVLNILELHVSAEGALLLMNWPPFYGNPFIYHYNKQTGEASQHNLITEMGLGYHEIGGFLQQKNGRIWVSGRPFLAEWLPHQKIFEPIANEYRNEQSIRFDQVSAWFEDTENNIWIGTDNGLYFFNPDAQKFNNYFVVRPGDEKVKEGPVHTVLQTRNGNILVGTWSVGLFYYNSRFNPIPLPPSLRAMQEELSVWDMVEHSKTGKIWIVLQGGGIAVYDPATGNTQREFPPIFNARTIRQVAEDKDGNLWFGTQGGMVIKWNYGRGGNDLKNNYQLVTATGLVHALEAD
ncbi:MAG: ligand-binding sensor domain-containing protein, partial [Chitinophagaceae bacterium]